jgi:hypothetical protein
MTDRRQILQVGLVATAGVILVPGCTSDTARDEQTPAVPDAQQADEIDLVAAYDAAIAAGGKNVAVLTRIRDEHREHLRGLGWESANGTASPTGEPSPGKAALLRAERRAARLRADGARDSAEPEEAQILSLIAASESQHVVILESL